jgi:predicted HD phosphohydrolase
MSNHNELPHERAQFTSFQESTKEDWSLIMRQIGNTQNMVANNALHLLRQLGNDHGGFPVSRLEHSLQTATRAEQDGRDAQYVVCALIHDIGDTLAPFNHPYIASTMLKPVVSEANHFMVAQHGIFQGYYFWHHIEEFCVKYDAPAFDPDFVSAPLEHFEPLVRELFAAKN